VDRHTGGLARLEQHAAQGSARWLRETYMRNNALLKKSRRPLALKERKGKGTKMKKKTNSGAKSQKLSSNPRAIDELVDKDKLARHNLKEKEKEKKRKRSYSENMDSPASPLVILVFPVFLAAPAPGASRQQTRQ
jgi:hypothetical protein